MSDINNANRYLFRGKRIDGQGWAEGSLISGFNGDVTRAFIFNGLMVGQSQPLEFGCEVDPSTVGQWKGAHDKNGVNIFEGDVFHLGDPNIKYVVEWLDNGFKGRQIGNKSTVGLDYWKERINILGNIHDNPDLLK